MALTLSPLTLTNPVVEAGITYPYVAVQMIVSPRVQNGGFINSAVFNFTPYRVMPNGTVEVLERDTLLPPAVASVLISDVTATAQIDQVTGLAMGRILAAIQSYLTAKGI